MMMLMLFELKSFLSRFQLTYLDVSTLELSLDQCDRACDESRAVM